MNKCVYKMTIILPRPQFVTVNPMENEMVWEKRTVRKAAIPPEVVQRFIEELPEKERIENEQ